MTSAELREIGFTPSGKYGVYSKRIHDLVWVEYDLQDGFVTLARKQEHPKQYVGYQDNIFDRVTLPGRRDGAGELQKLMAALEGRVE